MDNKLILFVAAVLVLATVAARADTMSAFALGTPWCPPVEEWPDPIWADPALVPDGALVQVGSRVFHTCTMPVSPLGERVMRVIFNPELAAGVVHKRHFGTLTVSDRLSSAEAWLQQMLRNKVVVGTRTMGGVVYREYDHWELEGEDRLLSSLFVYEPELNPGDEARPRHVIDCADKSRRVGGAVTCFVLVFYEDLRADIMVIGDAEGLAPVPRNSFPEMASDIERALRIMDVTDTVAAGEIDAQVVR